MGGGFAEDAQPGAAPRNSRVAPQPPLVYTAPRTGGGPAGVGGSALGVLTGAEVLAPVAAGRG